MKKRPLSHPVAPAAPARVPAPEPAAPSALRGAARRHLLCGWWLLLVYLSVGLLLEALHGFKFGWYLDVGNEMRRLMLTLGHAHGTLLALVNIAAGLTVRSAAPFELRASASFCVVWAAVLLPAGFFLGALMPQGGDPGIGVGLVPIGGFMLLYGVGRTAWDLTRFKDAATPTA